MGQTNSQALVEARLLCCSARVKAIYRCSRDPLGSLLVCTVSGHRLDLNSPDSGAPNVPGNGAGAVGDGGVHSTRHGMSRATQSKRGPQGSPLPASCSICASVSTELLSVICNMRCRNIPFLRLCRLCVASICSTAYPVCCWCHGWMDQTTFRNHRRLSAGHRCHSVLLCHCCAQLAPLRCHCQNVCRRQSHFSMGELDDVVRSLTDAAHSWSYSVSGMGASLNTSKCVAVANSSVLCAALTTSLSDLHISVMPTAVDLGVDFSAAGPLLLPKQNKRTTLIRDRSRNLVKLKGLKYRRAAIARSLITSASSYGFEVKGFSRKRMSMLRSAVARSAGLKVGARTSLTAQFQLLTKFSVDPMVSLPSQAIRRWCRMFWSGAHDGFDLQSIWSKYAALVGDKILSLTQSHGPVGVVFRLVQSVGWIPVTPTSWRTKQGLILDLLEMPPAHIAFHFTTALCNNMSESYSVDWDIARLLLGPTRRLRDRLRLAPFTQSPHPVLQLTQAQRHWFQALLEGKTWTHARLAQLGVDDGSCPLCSANWQDEFQRLWHCPATARIRSESGITYDDPRWSQLTVPEHFWSRLRPPADWFKVPHLSERIVTGNPPDWWLHSFATGYIFTDGSLIDGPGPCSRASWAFHCPGPPILELSGTLPGFFQTVPRAELYAICMAVQHSQPPLCVVTDHYNHVLKWEKGIQQVLVEYDSPLLDLWHWLHRLLREWPEGSFRMVWVPSHTDTLPEPLRTERIDKATSRAFQSACALPTGWIAGNQRADMLSQSMALSTRLPENCRAQYVQNLTLYADAVVAAARTLDKCAVLDPRTTAGERLVNRRAPPAPGNSMRSRPNRKNSAFRLGPQLQGHVTSWDPSGHWKCDRCHEVWRTRAMYSRFKSTRCRGFPQEPSCLTAREMKIRDRCRAKWIAQAAEQGLGPESVHSLSKHGSKWFCSICSRYSHNGPGKIPWRCFPGNSETS